MAPRRAARRRRPALRAAGRGGGALDELRAGERPLLALDPDGEPLDPAALPERAVLAFGTERHGLSDELLARPTPDQHPDARGVSSLNLATSVAAVLFAWRTRAADAT